LEAYLCNPAVAQWIGKPKKSNGAGYASGSGGAETPAILPEFAKVWFQLCKPMGEVTLPFVQTAQTNGKVMF
jgi:hypothetical protein